MNKKQVNAFLKVMGKDAMMFNADYAKKVQTLFGVGGLTLKLNGKLGAMVFENKSNDNKGYGIIMPLKV